MDLKKAGAAVAFVAGCLGLVAAIPKAREAAMSMLYEASILEPPPTDACDALAQPPRIFFGQQQSLLHPGVWIDEIDVTKALPACQVAITKYPRTTRYMAYLGRVYWAASREVDAEIFLNQAAAKGDVVGLTALGDLRYCQNSEKNRSDLRAAIAKGYPGAFGPLGNNLMYCNPIMPDEALRVLEQGVKAEQPNAATALAGFYFNPNSQRRDASRARNLYEIGVKYGSSEAHLMLGIMLLEGDGGPVDLHGLYLLENVRGGIRLNALARLEDFYRSTNNRSQLISTLEQLVASGDREAGERLLRVRQAGPRL